MTGSIECVACSSRSVTVVEQWPTGEGARAMACRDCGLLFVHPQPTPVSPQTATGVDQQARQSPVPGPVERRPTKRGAARALMAALDRHFGASEPAAGACALAFGSSSIAWLDALRECGWETAVAAESEAADARFDLVIAYQVLQRQHRPLDALRALSRSLRPGGYLLLSVPRLETLDVHKQVSDCLGPRKHIVAFTEACLRGLLARAGLQVVAALHHLDEAFTHGEPLRLRVLARKVDTALPEPNPAAALQPVFDALTALASTSEPARASEGPARPTGCPACSGSHVEVLDAWPLSGKRAHAIACMECGLLFVHPQPTAEVLDAYYARAGGYLDWKAKRLPGERTAWADGDVSPQTHRQDGARLLFPELDRFFPASAPPAGARVLDFGCGPGIWLDSFQDCGWETCGIEPCTDAAFVRHTRLPAVPSDPQFDLVFLYHVLEHLPRPLDTLRDLAKALRMGGYCFVSVPRIDTVAIHRQPDYCLHPLHHIVGFTEACLQGLLARSGLEVVAAFHDAASSHTKGLPTRLQLLARKAAALPSVTPDTASALRRVIADFVALKASVRSSPVP